MQPETAQPTTASILFMCAPSLGAQSSSCSLPGGSVRLRGYVVDRQPARRRHGALLRPPVGVAARDRRADSGEHPRLLLLIRGNRPELLEEPGALGGDRFVPVLLRDRAALELRARFPRPLLPREHLAEEEVRVEDVGAFLGVPGEGLARLVELALLGVDGPELPPSQAVFGR